MRNPSNRVGLILGLLLAMTVAAAAASLTKPSINKGAGGDLAIKGYDAVAYFSAGAAVKGDARFAHRWQEATWHFSSAKNRSLFARNPEKYAPQFGGYCAWAVSRGYTADVDPEAFRVVDGKLYLIYSTAVERRWEQDIPGNISRAANNWPAVLDK